MSYVISGIYYDILNMHSKRIQIAFAFSPIIHPTLPFITKSLHNSAQGLFKTVRKLILVFFIIT